MQMHEKLERSRTNARRALRAYREAPGVDPDDIAAIGDLIVDLLHLADSLPQDDLADWPPLLLDRANATYVYESDSGNADEEV